MKKLLATILAVVMVVSAGVACLFTSSAAEVEMSKGLIIDTGYGEFHTNNDVGSGAYAEFDLWLLSDDASLQFWADTATTRPTIAKEYVGVEKAGGGGGYDEVGNMFVSYDWGETGLTSDNHHHVKIEFGVNGSDNIWIDGVEVFHSGRTANSYWTGTTQILNTSGLGVVVDNFQMSNNSLIDFENGSAGYLGDLGGEITDVYVSIPKTETTKALIIDTGYGEFHPYNDVGSGAYAEFDLWLLSDDASLQFWADTATTRPTIAKEYVGVEKAGGGGGYDEVGNMFVSYDWGETGLTTDNHHHVKIEFGVNGSDNIWIDGVEVFHSGRTANSYWTGTTQILNTTGLGVMVDNFQMSNNSLIDFEDNNAKYLDLGGEITDAYLSIAGAEGETSKAFFMSSGYGYYNLYNAVPDRGYSVEFDLWLVSDDALIQYWADVAYTRYTIAKDYVGVKHFGSESAYPGDTIVSYNWGETGLTTDNHHHVKIDFGVDGSDNIWIDDVKVWTSNGITAKSYWSGTQQIFNTDGKGVIVDNYLTTNNAIIDFEDGDAKYLSEFGTVVDAVVTAGSGGVSCSHPANLQYVEREVEPTCQKTGLDVTYCSNCGEKLGEATVPTVDHRWPSRYQNVVDHRNPTADVDGYDTWGCLFNCGTTVRASIPATGRYTGTLKNYYDFDDAIVTHKIIQVFSGFEDQILIEDGVAKYTEGHAVSYWQNDATTVNSPTDYSVTFDFKYNNMFEGNDTAQYGHKLYFWFGGNSGIDNEMGYDFATGEFYLNSAAVVVDPVAYSALMDGEWHQIAFRVFVEDFDTALEGEHAFDDDWYYVSIECDGEELIRVGDFFDVTNLATAQNFSIIRNFGINCEIDNYVMGSADFRWVEPALMGDVNDDGVVDIRDARILKMYLANVEGVVVNAETADMNGNDTVDAMDLQALKALLAK